MSQRKQQVSQEIQDMIRSIVQREHTTVEPVYDPSRVYTYGAEVRPSVWTVPHVVIGEMRDWCSATYGPKPYGEYYGDRWLVSNNTFWFKLERDRTIFLIKWA